ncbi:MAG TPA: alkaline phosphatase family protein [Thermoplasmata archaeon]|nr:alkaline phosphatase family protein [Thermoplasmata archaeon]
MAGTHPRVLVLGLDSVSPWLLYERFLPKMPRMRELLARSRYGTLRSIDPPITVPAWAVMFSGVDPGTLGVYGFRHRRPGTYWDQYIPTSRTILKPMVWDRLSRIGKRVCIMGMPPGYPPPSVNGVYISDFLTPDNAQDYVSPAFLRPEIERVAGGYTFDVTFRADDRDRIGRELFEMTQKHFAVARHLWAKEKWDLFAIHEIGPDRLHHTFWKFFDQAHPRFEANPKFLSLVDEYYAMLDAEIGQLLDMVDDDVRILVVSDHGSQAMQGCFCINEWLIQKGYLTLKGPRPKAGTPIEQAPIDWSKTSAWGAGGYYARIFYNVKGREPNGTIAPADLPAFEAKLTADLKLLKKPDGQPLAVDVRVPKTIYKEVRGDAPDLMVYFDNAAWRSAGTIGYDSLYLAENDTGPDDSVHSFEGVYAISDPPSGRGTRGPEERLIDIAPTVLALLGVPIPPELQGRPIANV